MTAARQNVQPAGRAIKALASKKSKVTIGNVPTYPKDADCCVQQFSEGCDIKLDRNTPRSWADIFTWETMEAELEAATSVTHNPNYIVYLEYQKMGSMPLSCAANKLYKCDEYVPLALRPEEREKMITTTRTRSKKMVCSFWADRTCRAWLSGKDCEYSHPEDGEQKKERMGILRR